MNNRGRYRGVIQQPVPSADPQGRPARPIRDRNTGWRHYRRNSLTDQPPRSGLTDAPTETPTVPAARRPAPVDPPPLLGWEELDSLEELEKIPAKHTWRNLLAGIARLNLGPDAGQKYELNLQERVRTSVDTAFPLAVLNLKGGVGKTAVVEALGSTFAEARDDRVIAVDIDAGDLADRHGHRNPLSLLDLLAEGPTARHLDIRAYTYRNGPGLELLTLPDYAGSECLIGRDDIVKAFSILRRHYSVVLTDCGSSLKSTVVQAALLESRALVVVTSASTDAIRKTRTTLEWLRNNGYQKLIESTVLAINHIERGKPSPLAAREVQRLADQFTAQRVVVLPFDRHVHEGKEIILERLSKRSRRGYLEMAAALADMFREPR